MERVLVANRGEIAVRVFRAAHELGLRTVAVYTPEDATALHRTKAHEAYEIGEPGHPVRGYLDIEALLGIARLAGADAIHPGYGFLSESAALAEACVTAGITFVGPPPPVLYLTGDKVRARDAAAAAGLPVLGASLPLTSLDEATLQAAAEQVRFPLFVKASAGGGGRGLRLVTDPHRLLEAAQSASREAAAAFGDGTVFLEQAVVRPRHIEVQLLGDAAGGVVHLYDRDCSVQRRHQKVVEIAPAPGLEPALRQRLCDDAVAFARAVGYVNAGTVEFLVDAQGRHVFIEMNPRIQVEHTVTETVTGIDIVAAQLQIAGGATLAEIGLAQERISVRGSAVQCRVTTEDPADDFRPAIGTISVYRSPGGPGIRLDGATYAGAEVSPFFDSLLVKLTTSAPDLPHAARRARRALGEFRVQGVRTNIGFLRRVLSDPDLLAGRATTGFIDERPQLLAEPVGGDRVQRLLARLGESTVNGLTRPAHPLLEPRLLLPVVPEGAAPEGSRQQLLELGAEGFAAALRARSSLAVTDTTMRDAHQSLLATRMRTHDILAAGPATARLLPGLLSLEVWGGATYDVALRFLGEDPWQRLELLREAVPGICLQMLLRGRNAVGYTPYPDEVVRAFVREAARTGIDVFRVFDALNDVEQMRPAIEAVRETTAIAEGTLCYTGDLTDPAERLYTLEYYLRLADRLVEAGAHVLCIKDMAGLLRPAAARTLVTALRAEHDVPVHLHTHDTAGGQLATLLAAAEAGVDAVDAAQAPLSGGTSQVNLSALVAALEHTPRDTGLPLGTLSALEPYWEAVRDLYAPYEAGLRAPTGTVYRHEIPGGQLTNLRQQAISLGLGDRWAEVQERYADANLLLGAPIKVTPTSKVVGDLALFLASGDLVTADVRDRPRDLDLPASVLGYLAGELGTPPGGFLEPFRTLALEGRTPVVEPAELSPEDAALLVGEDAAAVRLTLSRLLFPGPTADWEAADLAYGDVTVLGTEAWLYGLLPGVPVTVELRPGVTATVELDTVSDPDDDAQRTLYVRVNGQPRPLRVLDRSVEGARPQRRRADPSAPGDVGAQLPGVVSLRVAVGDEVAEGDVIAVVEAMKMEAAVSAPVSGTVREVVTPSGANVAVGDLLLVLG